MNAVLGEHANNYYLLPVSWAFDRILNPDHNPERFPANVRAIAQMEYDNNADLHNISLEEYVTRREQEIRADMAALASNKQFFMMED